MSLEKLNKHLPLSPEEVHTLAWKGKWEDIEPKDLTQEHLEYKSIKEGTIHHAAARQGKFNFIPKKFHTLENYSQRDKNKQTVFEVALLYKHLWSIPEELINEKSAKITCKGVDSRSLYSHVLDYIRDKDFPRQWLSPNLLMLEEHDEMYYIHSLARKGRLHHLPKETFTEELVKLKDCGGSNLLHYSARYEGIGVLPKHFLTKSNLKEKSNNGKTPIHWALSNGKLEGEIPNEVLDKQILQAQDSLGETCYHCAVSSGSFEQLENIGPNLIDEEGLRIKDNNGKSSLDYTLDSYYTKENVRNLRITISKLGVKTLKDILHTRKESLIKKEVGKELIKRQIALGGPKGSKPQKKINSLTL